MNIELIKALRRFEMMIETLIDEPHDEIDINEVVKDFNIIRTAINKLMSDK